jgi:hypothetical protein
MTIENSFNIEQQQPGQHKESPSFSLSQATVGDLRAFSGRPELNSAQLPNLQIGEHSKELLNCSAKDGGTKGDAPSKPESREEQLDNKLKECFGPEVFDHLKDKDWLNSHEKELKEGFKKLMGMEDHKAWELANRIQELSKVNGDPLIFLKKQPSDTAGSLIPKRYDIFLKTPWYHTSNDLVGWLNHRQ